jgi:hypothetical protein
MVLIMERRGEYEAVRSSLSLFEPATTISVTPTSNWLCYRDIRYHQKNKERV